MVPFFARLIPLYLMIVRVGGANTYWGLIAPNYLSIFGIFFMKQYATTIPDELIQATRIDGASELQILFRIIFPLMKSAGFTLGAIKFIWTWNDFLWPLVLLSKQKHMTMPIAIATFVDPTTTSRYGPIMAGAIVMLIPVVVLFLVLQKQIVRGIVMSGFKA
jgi:multiple sugar transport system permease protein